MYAREFMVGQTVSVIFKGERVTGKVVGHGPTKAGRIYLIKIIGTNEQCTYYENQINI